MQFAPERRLAALVALTAPLWLLSGTPAGRLAIIVMTIVVAGAVAYDIVTMPRSADLRVGRAFPATIGVGDEAIGQYVVQSFWPHGLSLRLYDRLPAAIAPSEERSHTPVHLGPLGTMALERAYRGVRRGDHLLGPIAVQIDGRLGLIKRTLTFLPLDSIRGIPSVAAVRTFRLLSIQRRMRDAGVRAVRPRGDGRSFAGLRDYSLGDDPRLIDWKATARRGKLISREYAIEQGQQILIAIDAGRLMTQIAGAQPRFEYALSSALVLADIAAHSGDAVGVVVFDDLVRRYVAPARGRAAVRAVRDALTSADATMVESDYAAAFRTIAARQRNRALIVLFTDVLDVRSSQTLIAYLARSATRHLSLVVALRNEDLVEAALPANRETSAEVYKAAAAEELLMAREAALATMRAAGVLVANVTPNAMTAAVVNRYLGIKARAAL